MLAMDFKQKLEKLWEKGNFIDVGLDSEYARIPKSVKKGKSISKAILEFNKAIIDATHDLVCAYKPNIAFYEASGLEGLKALEETIQYLKQKYPDIPIILDAKRADIGNTSRNYAKAIFEYLQVDAVTVSPYLGKDAVTPFLEYSDKGTIVLVKTSNPGAGEFQDQIIQGKNKPLYQVVAENVAKDWNEKGNCGVVVGATYPEELKIVRGIVGDMPILIPGIGDQGGTINKVIEAGQDSRGWGMIINTSQSTIFASSDENFAEAARNKALEIRDQINKHRLRASV